MLKCLLSFLVISCPIYCLAKNSNDPSCLRSADSANSKAVIKTSTTQNSGKEIVVALDVNQSAFPLYLHPIVDAKSGFEPRYLQELESILRFDLDRTSFIQTVNDSRYRDQASREHGLRSFDLPNWRSSNVNFVVKAEVAQGMMSLSALNVLKGSIKGLDRIYLTGEINEDRQTMHRIADALHEAFFDTPGIAQSRILYTLRKKNQGDPTKWITEIWQCDYDGANAKQITFDNSLNISPVYIPPETGYRGSQFLYVSYKMGQPKIFAATIQEGIGRRVVFLRGDQLTPAISPQKDKIAFISDATGNPDLFIQNYSAHSGAYGRPECLFSSLEGAQGSPAFNPDGTKIAFVSNKDGYPRIYLISLTSPKTPPVMITKRNMENTCPAWSPDGTKLAYSAMTKGVRQIWIYDLATQKESQLTDTPGNKENPSWAPDNAHLVFNSSGAHSSELYIIDLHKKEAVQITQGTGEKRFPAWEPFSCDSMKKTTTREKII